MQKRCKYDFTEIAINLLLQVLYFELVTYLIIDKINQKII